jgi:hypothetical protein
LPNVFQNDFSSSRGARAGAIFGGARALPNRPFLYQTGEKQRAPRVKLQETHWDKQLTHGEGPVWYRFGWLQLLRRLHCVSL